MAQVHPCQALALIVLIIISVSILMTGIAVLRASGGEDEPFEGPHWNHPGETIEVQQLLTAKYLRVESHTIRSSGGEVVPGWIWVDFYDQVDVLVEDAEGRFILYKQTNYGLPSASLAALSARVSPHEYPLKAAKKELAKEMGRRSRHWVDMGTYRLDANRGGGFVTCFLARWTEKMDESQRQSTDDLESKTLVRMTRRELRKAVLTGKVLEVKWANTLAMALLHLEHMDAKAAAAAAAAAAGGGGQAKEHGGGAGPPERSRGGDGGGGGGAQKRLNAPRVSRQPEGDTQGGKDKQPQREQQQQRERGRRRS